MKEEFKPQAGLPLSNAGGISIEINDSGRLSGINGMIKSRLGGVK